MEVEHGLKNIGVHKHMSIPGKGNVKARVRMVVQYALAFEQNLIVVGTDQHPRPLPGSIPNGGTAQWTLRR
ncbi:NH(3)-dependent NAD(+) synthetase [Actinobacillus pleuropneumoniae]|nr:NH(3)-dependent NAD(+) synthetase [Actinobacillus pleuropneumoniae]